MGALTTAYVAVLPDMGRFGPELKLGLRRVDVSSSGRDAGKRFSSGFGDKTKRALKSGLIGTGLAAGGAFAGALTKGFGRLSAIENAEAKLTGLGHSAKAVDKIMTNALASVKGTAFGLDEASTLAATAVAAGIKPGRELERTLKLVADAATIGGTSLSDMGAIFNQVAASNKVQGDTINQLNERGIPILKLLADVTGRSQAEVSALASKGKIDFATFQKAMEKGLGGAALKSGNTASGAFKNMGAAFSRVGAALLKGVFPQIGAGFGGITKALDAITPGALRFGEIFGASLTQAAEGVKAFAYSLRTGFSEDEGTRIERVGIAIHNLWQTLRTGMTADDVATPLERFALAARSVWQTIQTQALPALKQLGGFVLSTLLPAWLAWYKFLGSQLAPILKQVGGFVLTSIVPAFLAVAKFIGTTVVPAFLSIVETIKGLIRVVAPIIGQIVGAVLGKFGEMRPQIVEIWGSIKEIVTSAMVIIRTVIAAATKLIQVIWSRWGDNILAVLKTVVGTVVPILSSLFKIIAGVFKTLAAVLNGDWSAAWGGLRQIVQGNLDLVFALLKGAARIIGGLLRLIWEPIVTSARDAWARALQTVSAAWRRIGAALSTGVNTIVTPVRRAWEAVRDATLAIWDRITGGIRTTLRVWLTVVKVTITAIVTAAILAFRPLQRGVQVVFNFIKDRVIVPVWRAIRGVFVSTMAAIRSAFSAWWDRLRSNASAVWNAVYRTVIEPVWRRIRAIFTTVMGVIRGLFSTWWNNLRNNATTIFNAIRNVINTVWTAIRSRWTSSQTAVRSTWSTFWGNIRTAASNAMNAVRTSIDTVLGRIRNAFATAKTNISRTWSGVRDVVSGPIQWVKNNVYNRPLVPVWNRVASLVNGPKLSAYATGGIDDSYGIRPGYTPGRDTHLIAVGGGEPVLRPEAGRVLGRGWVDGVNRSARTGGVSGVQSFLAGGGEGFAGGGIVGWLKNTIGSAGAAIGGLAAKLKDWALGGLRDAAAKVLAPLRGVIRSQLSGSGVKDTVGKVANKALDLILDKIKSSDAAATAAMGGGGGPIGAGGFARAEAWARTQIGKPYRFAAVGPGSYDCSGFVGAIQNVIQGHAPHHRIYSSGTFLGGPHARSGLTRDKVSPFRIGVIPTGQNGGRIGHMAATLNGRNFESAGGVGTRSGGSARGWNNGLFKYHYGLARGGIAGDFAFDTLDRRGQRFDPAARALVDMLYDSHALAGGAVIRGGRGGVLAHIGEGANDELVTPLRRGWQGRGADDKIDRLIAAIEEHGLNGHTFSFGDIINPREETLSQTTNRVLQRVSALPLV